MGIISNIKERIADYAEEQKERREFQKLVDKETLPLRRGAYLKQRLAQAIEEGKAIAQQELAKKRAKEQEKRTRQDFNIEEPVNQWKPTLGLNMQESFKAATNTQVNKTNHNKHNQKKTNKLGEKK